MEITAYKPSDELIRLVASLRGTWSGYRAMCHCPAHADRSNALQDVKPPTSCANSDASLTFAMRLRQTLAIRIFVRQPMCAKFGAKASTHQERSRRDISHRGGSITALTNFASTLGVPRGVSH